MGLTMISKMFKTIREKQNIKVSELAKLAGVTRKSIYAIESGRSSNPSADILSKLLKILGTDIDTFMNNVYEDVIDYTDQRFPDSLIDFANKYSVPTEDLKTLSYIRYRGKVPQTVNDWWFIYEALKRSVN